MYHLVAKDSLRHLFSINPILADDNLVVDGVVAAGYLFRAVFADDVPVEVDFANLGDKKR